MNAASRIITGGLIILLGLWFIFFIGFIDGPGMDVIGIIIGILFFILGFFILLNEKEDEIEGIKDSYLSKSKRFAKEKIKSIETNRK